MKPSPPSIRRGSALLIGLMWLGLLGTASAQVPRADRDMPMEIDAGKVHIDGKRKVRLLSGGVEIRRGTLLIRADSIELRQTGSGEQLTALGSETEPALFRQKREGFDEVIEGRAQRVEYDAGSEIVKLQQQAVLRRWNGSVLSDELSGQSIVYDHARDSFEVLGGGGDGRVRAVIAPRKTPAGQSRPAERSSSSPTPGADR